MDYFIVVEKEQIYTQLLAASVRFTVTVINRTREHLLSYVMILI
jgi:hypothetical protein